jgi:beta-fructofuranosidase
VVDGGSGAPLAFYTRVRSDDLGVGSIAVARCDRSGQLVSRLGDVVIAGPPDGMPITAFRDPYVWREQAGWRMIVGGGTADGRGAVLQYGSQDLDHWQYRGVLCSGRAGADDDATRQVWECPQMVEIGDVWALVVSVGLDDRAGYVAASVGRYDGARFVPNRWHRLAFGTAPYATSVFRDRDGRPCMISWLREDLPYEAETSAWAGAHSLVSELGVDRAARVTASPHAGLVSSGAFVNHSPVAWPWVHDLEQSTPAHATHVNAASDSHSEMEVRCSGKHLVRVTRSPSQGGLVVDRPGHPIDVIPAPIPEGAIDVFIDADILEIFSAGCYGAWRLTCDA